MNVFNCFGDEYCPKWDFVFEKFIVSTLGASLYMYIIYRDLLASLRGGEGSFKFEHDKFIGMRKWLR